MLLDLICWVKHLFAAATLVLLLAPVDTYKEGRKKTQNRAPVTVTVSS